MNGEVLTTTLVLDTSDVEKGSQRAIRAYDRMAQRAAAFTQNTAIKREEKLWESSARDVEKMEAESYARRLAKRKTFTEAADKLERNRVRSLVDDLRNRSGLLPNTERAGLGRIGGMASERAASGGGHHGLIAGNQVRVLGDLLDGITGHRGFVMKLGAANQLLPALGRMLGGGLRGAAVGAGALAVPLTAGFMGYKAWKGDMEMQETGNGLGRAIGEHTLSPWAMFNGIIPNRFSRYDVEAGDIGKNSAAGMSEQRAKIQDEIAKTQESRGYWAKSADTLGIGHMDESFAREGRAQDRLDVLDQSQAGLAKEDTAARRMQTFGDTREAAKTQIELEKKKKLDELHDDQVSDAPKMGQAEASARRKDIISESEEKETQRQRAAAAEDRELKAQSRMTDLRAGGKNMEMGAGFINLQKANGDLSAAQQTKDPATIARAEEAVKAAKQELVETLNTVAARKALMAIEKSTAEFRGNADERELKAAQAAVESAQTARDFAKTDVEWTQKDLDLTKAIRAEEETRLQIAQKRATSAFSVAQGKVGLAASRFALTQDTNSPNEGVRFAAAQNVARAQSEAEVESAKLHLLEAQSKVATEIATRGKASEDSKTAQVLAEQNLKSAQDARLQTEKKLTAEADQQKFDKQQELAVAQSRASVATMQAAGYGRQAQLKSSRDATEAAKAKAIREGHPEIAAQLEKDQSAEERMADHALNLNPDGTKRSPAQVQAQLRGERMTQDRTNRYDARRAKDRTIDPLTGGAINGPTRDRAQWADQFSPRHASALRPSDSAWRQQFQPHLKDGYARKADPHADAKKQVDSEKGASMADVYKILNERLPKAKAQ